MVPQISWKNFEQRHVNMSLHWLCYSRRNCMGCWEGPFFKVYPLDLWLIFGHPLDFHRHRLPWKCPSKLETPWMAHLLNMGCTNYISGITQLTATTLMDVKMKLVSFVFQETLFHNRPQLDDPLLKLFPTSWKRFIWTKRIPWKTDLHFNLESNMQRQVLREVRTFCPMPDSFFTLPFATENVGDPSKCYKDTKKEILRAPKIWKK